MINFFQKAGMQNHPLRILNDFLKQEEANKKANKYNDLRFVGYVLEIGYDTVTIITSDPFKLAVGGIPRNSFLIMIPSNYEALPPHFTLLRVIETAPTPLTKEVQQTYFELQKRSMPEIDVFTQSELQWGALKTAVLGMYYPHPKEINKVEFSNDLNNFESAHKYRVFSPNEELLNLIINVFVPETDQFAIGGLRMTECRLTLPQKPLPKVEVKVAPKDFMGARTSMFGKTRLGKSNVVKLIIQSLIKTTATTKNVGQIVFDINGEYANDNPQDNSRSIASAYPSRCHVYAITPKVATPSKPLKLNFYEHPDRSHIILKSLLDLDAQNANYVNAFKSCVIPSLDEIKDPATPRKVKLRMERRVLMYWAILHKAGYDISHTELSKKIRLNPRYNKNLRDAVYPSGPPPAPNNLDRLVSEFEAIKEFIRRNKDSTELLSSSGNPLFESDELALLFFLRPNVGSGTIMIQPYRIYHDKKAGNFTKEIIDLIDKGGTVILDLGNADPKVMEYFSFDLSVSIFRHQVNKFSNNKLGNHYIQLIFEEAHNLFPAKEKKEDIYQRIAKEGAKYHIGMVYSTQSPTSISEDLLAQTENFFVAHLSAERDANKLAKVNIAYKGLQTDILRARTIGYIRMLTRSHRFVIPVQAKLFTPP